MDEKPVPVLSKLSDVVLPVEYVTLTKLKDRGGLGVVVGCGAIRESRMVDLVRSVPGARVPVPGEDDIKKDPALMEAIFRDMLLHAPALITEGCFLEGANGDEVRPAFYFDAPIPGALPGHYLSDGDRMLLMNALMRVGGFLEGAAADASFSGGKRSGDDDSHGAGGSDADAGDERP